MIYELVTFTSLALLVVLISAASYHVGKLLGRKIGKLLEKRRRRL